MVPTGDVDGWGWIKRREVLATKESWQTGIGRRTGGAALELKDFDDGRWY